jgi:hypothetical protein
VGGGPLLGECHWKPRPGGHELVLIGMKEVNVFDLLLFLDRNLYQGYPHATSPYENNR